MAKEWANKDRYKPSHGVPKPRMLLTVDFGTLSYEFTVNICMYLIF
jgi:hypothetical protein